MTRSLGRWLVCMIGGVALLATACGGTAAPGGQGASGSTAKPAASASSAAPAASSSSAAPSGPLGALYAQAKKEGTVIFHSPTHLSEIQPVLKLFNQEFPGVRVQYSNVTAEQVLQILMTQEAAHNVQVDLAQGADDNLALLTDHHLMASVDWAKYGVPAGLVSDGAWVRWYDLPNIVAYNTNMVKGAEIPASWNDLLNPRWSGGKIAIDGRGHFLNAFLADPSLGEAAGVAFAKKLAAQKPLDEARLSSANQAISSGEVPVGTSDMEQMLVAKDKGAPIDLAPVSPIIATAFGLYVPPGAPHPAAAELLAAWLVTPKAEAALQKASYYALASPCSASRMAGMFCAKHVTVEHLGSLANIRKDPAYLKSVEQALGTYKGK